MGMRRWKSECGVIAGRSAPKKSGRGVEGKVYSFDLKAEEQERQQAERQIVGEGF